MQLRRSSKEVQWRDRLISDIEPTRSEVLAYLNLKPVLTRGNYTIITGLKKSRKTLLAAYIMSLIDGEILVIDSEQSEHHVWQLHTRIKSLKQDVGHVVTLYLRGLPVEDKLRLLEQAVEDNPNVKAILFDNIRDLMYDINDMRNAFIVITKLEEITLSYNVGLLGVIHQNKSDKKIRGHIGAELENRAYMIIETTRNGNVSTVRSQSSRDGDFTSFTLRHNPETGNPEVMGVFSESEIIDKIKAVFAEGELRYRTLIDNIRVEFGPTGDLYPEAKAREIKDNAIENGWIVKIGNSRSPSSIYRLSPDLA